MDAYGGVQGNLLQIICILAFMGTVLASVLEGALHGFSWKGLEERLKDKTRREAIEKGLEDWDRALASVKAADALCNLVLVVTVSFIGLAGEENASRFVLVVLLSLVATVYLGDLVPFRMGELGGERIVVRMMPALRALVVVMAPLAGLAELTQRFVSNILGLKQPGLEAEITDDILSAVEEGEREGVLEAEGAEMIEGVIDLKNADVADVMTPRTEMVSASVEEGLETALALVAQTGHSRIPIYQVNRDNVIGVLYVRDVLQYWGKKGAEIPPLQELCNKPFFVPETKKIDVLLREFQKKKVHIAIVLDEYGGTAGLVTIEDILEEIVGEIADEYDEEDAAFKRIDDATLEADARVHIDEIYELVGLKLPEQEDYDTLGGFLFAQMGKVPRPGERFVYLGATFTVLDADNRKINRVRIQLGSTAPMQP